MLNRIYHTSLATLLFFIGITTAFADANEESPESRFKLTAENAHDRARELINQSVEFNRLKKIDQKLNNLEEAYEILDQYPNQALRCEVDALRALVYLDRDEVFLALEYAEKSRLVAFKLENMRLMARATSTIGAVYIKLRAYEDAIKILQESYQYGKSIQDHESLLSTLNNLAICYWRLKNWELSEKYLRLAISRLDKKNPHYYLLQGNIGLILLEQGKFEESEALLQNTYTYHIKNGSKFSKLVVLSNIADLEMRKGNYDRAIELANESMESAIEQNNTYFLARIHRHLGRALMGKELHIEAESALRKSLKFAFDLNDAAEKIDTQAALFELYKTQGKFEQALRLQLEMSQQEKEINSNSAKAESILFNVRFETEKKEQQIELLKAEKELAESIAIAQKIKTESIKDELAITEQLRKSESKLRNLMVAALVGFLVAVIMLLRKVVIERKLTQNIQRQKTLLDQTNTDLVKTNLRLEELNKEKDEILSIVVHDLRNPLSTQMGIGQILSDSSEDIESKQLSELGRDIIDSADRMNEIILLLQNADQLEQGAIKPQIADVDLKEVMEKTTHNHEFHLKRKGQKLETKIEASLPTIKTDRMMLTQAIENILSNAIKYSPKYKTIRINAVTQDNKVLISICDEGPGIPKEDQETIFQKYKRTSNTPTGGESTVGLGLAIVKQLVELLNGKTWVESKENEGAQFFISLPIQWEE